MAVVATANGMLAAVQGGTVVWVDTLDAEAIYTPAVSGDAVIVTGKSGHVWSVDLGAGKVRWKETLGVPASAEPLVRNGWVAVTSVDGTLWFLDEATGAVIGRHVFDAIVHEPPVWAFGRLYVVTEDKRLHAFGTGTEH
jgi:serine/threonine-protein kinase